MIEEDGKIAALVAERLKDIQCDLKHTATGESGLILALQNRYDLIIVDLLLPDTDGVALSRQLRKEQIQTPIMMLTAKQAEEDRIGGVEDIADDYLTKPFSLSEFIARVKAILRSTEAQQGDEGAIIIRGKLVLDKTHRKVSLDGAELDISFKEFDLLQLLMSNPGKTYTRENLLSEVWGYGFTGLEHTVETHIGRLRAVIEKDVLHPEYILTTWGIGYRFTEVF